MKHLSELESVHFENVLRKTALGHVISEVSFAAQEWGYLNEGEKPPTCKVTDQLIYKTTRLNPLV